MDEERIVLNESSVWSGSPQNADRPDAYKVLPEIQKLLLEGKNPEAEALVNANIGPDGSVMEWPEPYKETEPHHRHISHLWGFYPGNEICPARTPDLAEAARKTLLARSDDSLGWSYAFKAALWARLGDGNHAWRLVQSALTPVVISEIHYDNGGGVYPNMFDACPPFQVDANLGVPAAIGEMLLQSGDGQIHLLPASPDAWKNGSVSGLRARGGFQVDMVWRNGTLVSAIIHSDLDLPCSVSYAGHVAHLNMKAGKAPQW